MKPQIQKEVAVYFCIKCVNHIVFYATNDAASEFEEFGELRVGESPNEFELFVDPRFDFDEVLAYIENYGENSTPKG